MDNANTHLSAEAMEAAMILTENLKRYINPAFLTEASINEMAAIIQEALNKQAADMRERQLP